MDPKLVMVLVLLFAVASAIPLQKRAHAQPALSPKFQENAQDVSLDFTEKDWMSQDFDPLSTEKEMSQNYGPRITNPQDTTKTPRN